MRYHFSLLPATVECINALFCHELSKVSPSHITEEAQARKITKQPNLTAIIQSRHNARMVDEADAKMILMAPPPDNWKRPPGRPRITWLNTVDRDLRAYNLTLNEAVDLAQNHPLCRLMSTYGTTHS